VVLAVLWYSVRVRQWWCVRRGTYVLLILSCSGVGCAVVLSKVEAVVV
jgi:hypothetical protein